MNNSSMHHSFDISIATEFGDVNLAIMIHNLQFWIMLNKRKGINRHEDRTWTYQTLKDFAACFPYWSVDQVNRLLRKAVDLKIIQKGNFNHKKFDQTTWYAFVDEERFCISHFTETEMHLAKSPTPFIEIAKPIPDTKTNTEFNIKEVPRKEAATSSTPIPFSPSSKKTKKESVKKIPYGSYVQLLEGELESLCNELGKDLVEYYINAIDLFVPNRKEGPYKDYAAVIRQWSLRDRTEGKVPKIEKLRALTVQPVANHGSKPETAEHIKRICNRLDNALTPRATAQTFFYARGDHALMVNKHKDFEKTYYYASFALEQFKEIILQDLDICFPGAREHLFPNTDYKVKNLIQGVVEKTKLGNGG